MSHSPQFKAKKSLGQNFLTDNQVLQEIADAVHPKKGDTIVEIGPGHGELTQFLVDSGAKVIAIEKDPRLTINLKQLTINHKNLEIIDGDALRILPELSYKLSVNSYKLCGNIPYYITGHLFRIISELKNKPSTIVFTIQKEVAERICAEQGNMNILAASIQIWAKPEIVRIIPKTAFLPSPKVDSAVIKLTINNKQLTINQMGKYYKLVKVLFKQPRKTIWNNLKELTINDKQLAAETVRKKLAKIRINPEDRPEDLSVENIAHLSTVISK